MFFNHNGIQLEMSNREIAEDSPNIGKLNSMLLNNQIVLEWPIAPTSNSGI